jgi:integrase
MATSTINRDLATLRRMFKLATEWETVSKLLPKVRLLPGENRRERVVTTEEEDAYLSKAAPLLRDFAVLGFDCGLRPEEAHRLTWAQIRAGNVDIHKGKTKDARRRIPASPRVLEMLRVRKASSASNEWVFPAPTATGHINDASLKKQHAAAIKAAKLEPFVPYSLRQTCPTRWAEGGVDPFYPETACGTRGYRYHHAIHTYERQAGPSIYRKSVERAKWAQKRAHG